MSSANLRTYLPLLRVSTLFVSNPSLQPELETSLRSSILLYDNKLLHLSLIHQAYYIRIRRVVGYDVLMYCMTRLLPTMSFFLT